MTDDREAWSKLGHRSCAGVSCEECARRRELQGEGVSTWYDLVRKYIPSASDDECDHILWEETAFPCAGLVHVEKQIAELASKVKP